jgi:hypothetical protein
MQKLREPTLGAAQSAATRTRTRVNWARFWIQSAVLAVAFNVLAGLGTWYWIFPRLFPVR